MVARASKPSDGARAVADPAAAALDATDVLTREVDLAAGQLDAGSRLALLRERYLELARKYTGVVTLLEKHATQQAIVFRLGLWALNVTANGLAVVRDGAISMQNARWLQLDDHARTGWRLEDDDGATYYPDLTHLARAEARRLPERAPANAVRRFARLRGEEVIEVRFERPESDPRVVLVIAHDATEQVRARRELSETREALLQNEQLAVVGELASSIAHDLGNTLRGISARVAVLESGEPNASAKAAVIDGLHESVELAIAAVRNLQDVARVGRLEPGPVHLDEVVRRAAEILYLRQPRDSPRVEVQAQVSDQPPVLGTVSELSHLFMTLFFNARDAMPKGGNIVVMATRERERVHVSVRDSGTGFPADALTHLFQPFFTTKGKAGTGLGLWLAQSTMRRFGGTIAARNLPGGGAEVELEFQTVGDGEVRRDRGRGRPRERRARSS
jgi:signal transduction histidine kinase